MKAIETNFDGRRFRSRAEARWAVFLKELGLPYEYEPEGVVLGGMPYLPDFRVPSLNCWIEVKGQEPSDVERQKCALLARESGMRCLLAIGMPQPVPHILLFTPDGDPSVREIKLYFAEDRRDEGVFWIYAPQSYGVALGGPGAMTDHHREPLVHWSVERAYRVAQSARFEFGESG